MMNIIYASKSMLAYKDNPRKLARMVYKPTNIN